MLKSINKVYIRCTPYEVKGYSLKILSTYINTNRIVLKNNFYNYSSLSQGGKDSGSYYDEAKAEAEAEAEEAEELKQAFKRSEAKKKNNKKKQLFLERLKKKELRTLTDEELLFIQVQAREAADPFKDVINTVWDDERLKRKKQSFFKDPYYRSKMYKNPEGK
jgi:superfamily I DNA and/or RNA helicase